MARHRLTKQEQKRGVEKALKSPRTPPQLKKGLKKREEQLSGKADESRDEESSSREE